MLDSKGPVLSIIVPAYNAEKTLRRCIDSILDQGDAPIEVIVSNDGSTDHTWAIVQEYMEQDPRVRGITSANGGASSARNRAINLAKGQWIAFVDSDDYVERGFFKRCAEVLIKENPDILDYLYCGDFDGVIHPVAPNKIPKDTLLDRAYIVHNIIPVLVNVSDKMEYFVNDFLWTKAYKTDIIKKNGIYFEETRKKWEDRLFTIMFLKHANSYYSMSARGYYYVGHGWGESLSTSFDDNVFKMAVDSYHKYRELYGDIYDFTQPYTTQYYCELLLRVAVDQFKYDIEREKRESMFRIFVEEPVIMDLLSRFAPEEQWKKDICTAVMKHEPAQLYALFEKQYIKRKRQEKDNILRNAIRRILSGIKRRIIK